MAGDGITSEQFLEKLKRGLALQGDFPSSARVVNKLKELAGNPNTPSSKMCELILSDPALSIRILNFVNSAFYQRGTRIETISQSLIHIGTKQLADLCSNFTLLQKLVPTARKGGPFARALERLMVTSVILSNLKENDKDNSQEENRGYQRYMPRGNQKSSKEKNKESFYLLGTFSELGLMLTAYYFPKLFENANERAIEKKISLNESIKELTGLTPLQISKEVLISLKLPENYVNTLNQVITLNKAIERQKNNKDEDEETKKENIKNLIENSSNETKFLMLAQEISSDLIEEHNNKPLNEIIQNASDKFQIEQESLKTSIMSINEELPEYCDAMQIELPTIKKLSEEIENKQITLKEDNDEDTDDLFDLDDSPLFETEEESRQSALLSKYKNDIKDEIANDESLISIITSVMEACIWGLEFNRALLFLSNEKKDSLYCRMSLGNIDDDIDTNNLNIQLNIINTDAVSKCFYSGKVTTTGTMILPKDSSFICIPIGLFENCIGIIYVSRSGKENSFISSFEKDNAMSFANELERKILREKRGKTL